MDLFGRSVTIAKCGNQCVCCGQFDPWVHSVYSRMIYNQVGLCRACQEMIRAVPMNEELAKEYRSILLATNEFYREHSDEECAAPAWWFKFSNENNYQSQAREL